MDPVCPCGHHLYHTQQPHPMEQFNNYSGRWCTHPRGSCPGGHHHYTTTSTRNGVGSKISWHCPGKKYKNKDQSQNKDQEKDQSQNKNQEKDQSQNKDQEKDQSQNKDQEMDQKQGRKIFGRTETLKQQM